jgi:hypothetical protein
MRAISRHKPYRSGTDVAPKVHLVHLVHLSAGLRRTDISSNALMRARRNGFFFFSFKLFRERWTGGPGVDRLSNVGSPHDGEIKTPRQGPLLCHSWASYPNASHRWPTRPMFALSLWHESCMSDPMAFGLQRSICRSVVHLRLSNAAQMDHPIGHSCPIFGRKQMGSVLTSLLTRS